MAAPEMVEMSGSPRNGRESLLLVRSGDKMFKQLFAPATTVYTRDSRPTVDPNLVDDPDSADCRNTLAPLQPSTDSVASRADLT
jgi:hypothetical protein